MQKDYMRYIGDCVKYTKPRIKISRAEKTDDRWIITIGLFSKNVS